MCVGFFFAAVLISSLRDALPKKYQAFVPLPMAAAIPFYIGAQLAVSHHLSTLQTTPYNECMILLPLRPDQADFSSPNEW